MFTDFVVTVISSAAVSVALSGLLVWLTKTWISERLKNAIKAEYDIKLESHKAQLKARSDVALEQLKSSLSIAANQRNVAFSQLHSRRVDIVADTYGRLMRLHESVADYIKPFEGVGERSREERRKDVVAASSEFTTYFLQNQIFLSQPVAQAIHEVNRELVTISTRYIYSVEFQEVPDFQQWITITEKFEGSVKEAVTGLEKQLRQLLGDEA